MDFGGYLNAFFWGMLSLKCLRCQEVIGNVSTMLRREIIPRDVNTAVNGAYIRSESLGISKIIRR